jgi:hypothetical protein
VLAPDVSPAPAGTVGDYFVDAHVCTKYNINPSLESNGTSVQPAESSKTPHYGSALYIFTKSNSPSGRHIYTGDNEGSIHVHNIEGKHQNSVSVTPSQRVSGIQKGRVNLFVSSGNTISMLFSPSKLNKLPQTCLGPKENIVEMIVDPKNMNIIFAKLVTGEVVVFNVKYREPRVCYMFIIYNSLQSNI